MRVVGEVEIVVTRKVEQLLAVDFDLSSCLGIDLGRPFQSLETGFIQYRLYPVLTHKSRSLSNFPGWRNQEKGL